MKVSVQVIEELKTCNADIIALQEIDIACERSGSLNTGKCIPVWDNASARKKDSLFHSLQLISKDLKLSLTGLQAERLQQLCR